MNYRAYAAELIGTFLLALIVLIAASAGGAIGLPVPVLAGGMLMIMVYIFGSVSGSHLNPAQTIALYTAKKISLQDGVGYIIAQFIGAFLAMQAASPLGSTVISSGPDHPLMYFGEALGAAVLLFGVSAVVWKKVPGEISGIVIGSSLALGALVASVDSAGILNPAVAFALGSFSFAYVLGPIIGAVVAVWVYQWIVD